jgi:hypothetical protein
MTRLEQIRANAEQSGKPWRDDFVWMYARLKECEAALEHTRKVLYGYLHQGKATNTLDLHKVMTHTEAALARLREGEG